MSPSFFRFRARFLFPVVALALLPFNGGYARTEIPSAAQPQLAAGANGGVWLVYGQVAAAPAAHAHGGAPTPAASPHGPAADRPAGEIFIRQSDDGGATFAPAIKIATVPALMLGMRRGPRIAAHGEHLTVTVVGSELLAFRSVDAGRTWSAPVQVNDVPASAAEGLHDLAAAPGGNLFITWLDLRNGKMELWSAESTDAGRSWGKNQQVYRSPDKSICECCHPSALFDAAGNLAVMWRNSIAGSRDMWMATRANGAKEFSAAQKLGEGTWPLNACPMDGGKIIALGGGKFGAVWQRDGGVFFAPASGPEISLGQGKQPVAIGRGTETIILWQQGNDLVRAPLARPGAPSKFAAEARFATALVLSGNRGTVVAYEQGPAKEKQPGIVVDRL